MKRIMVAMVAVMFLLGFNSVSFADEKGGKMETKGDAKGGEKKEEKKKEEKKK